MCMNVCVLDGYKTNTNTYLQQHTHGATEFKANACYSIGLKRMCKIRMCTMTFFLSQFRFFSSSFFADFELCSCVWMCVNVYECVFIVVVRVYVVVPSISIKVIWVNKPLIESLFSNWTNVNVFVNRPILYCAKAYIDICQCISIKLHANVWVKLNKAITRCMWHTLSNYKNLEFAFDSQFCVFFSFLRCSCSKLSLVLLLYLLEFWNAKSTQRRDKNTQLTI